MVSFNQRYRQTDKHTYNYRPLNTSNFKTRTLVSSLFMLHVVNCKQEKEHTKKNIKKTSIITYYNLGGRSNEANCI